MMALLKMLKFLKKYRSPVILSLFLLLISSALIMIQPKLIEWAIDRGIEARNIQNIILSAIGMFAAAVVANGVNFASGYLLIKTGQGLGYEMKNTLYQKVMSFSFGNLDKWRTGELLVRMNADVNTIRMFIRMGLLMIIQSLLMLAGGLVFMFMTHVKLASIIGLFMSGILLLFFFIATKVRPLFLLVRDKLDKLNNTLQENLAGAKVVRAYNRQDHEMKRFNVLNTEFYKKSLKVGYLIAVLFPMLMFIGNLAMFIVLWVGGQDVIAGMLNPGQAGLTIGQLIAFNNYTMLVIFPILMLAMVLNFISMASASAIRIDALLKEKSSVKELPDAVSKSRFEGEIEFKNVSFRYGDGQNAVDNISMVIKPGEKVGILGTTASGKSSFIHLIMRFYDPQEGTILIDGRDIKEYTFSSLRKNIAMVLQDSLLFSGTIKENIVFGKPEASDAEMKNAAELACAYDFIMKKESGWDEPVGERGSGLSGGQRQRVALARAIISDPDLLILDDVTSSLDLKTEQTIVDNLYRSLKRKTCLIISQKISTIRRADKIVVFENGCITAMGTHDELMKNSGLYHDIAETQSSQIY